MKFNDYNKKLGNINKDSAVINLNYYKKIKNNYPLLFEQQNNNILFQVFSDNYQLILFYVYNGMIIGEMINTYLSILWKVLYGLKNHFKIKD